MFKVFISLALVASFTLTAIGQWSFAGNLHMARSGATAAALPDGKIYVAGGNVTADPDMTSVFEEYDPVTRITTLRAPMPTPRTALAGAASLGRFYTFGGCPASHGWGGLSTVEVYDPLTNTWSQATPMPTPRTGLKAVTARDGRIYVIGGHNEELGHLNTVEIYDPRTDTWTAGSPMPTARQGFGAALGLDGRIYVIGGTNNWRTGIMSKVEIYDPSSDSWTTGAPMPTPRDGLGVATGADGRILAAGGWTGDFPHYGDIIDTVESYDPATNTWSAAPRMMQPEYSVAMTSSVGCRVFAISGGDYSSSSLIQSLDTGGIIRNRTKTKCGPRVMR